MTEGTPGIRPAAPGDAVALLKVPVDGTFVDQLYMGVILGR
jgi:hypothetical protein